MTNANISFADFKNVLADLFGQSLNQKAEVAAQNFWQNVPAISDGVCRGSIAINVDVLGLARAFPEYKTYQVWSGWLTATTDLSRSAGINKTRNSE